MSLQTSELAATVPMEFYIEKAKMYIQNSKSQNTRKAYKTDWLHFCTWCISYHVSALPATSEIIIAYLTYLAEDGRKTSTIIRRMSTIRQAHRLAGVNSPTQDQGVREVIQGIKHTLSMQVTRKKPLQIEHLRKIINKMNNNLIDQRDTAILLIGFAGAFRRSELVGINLEDITFTKQGMEINVLKSKTDQEGKGMTKAIPYGTNKRTCPIHSLQIWLKKSNISAGPIFRPITRHSIILENRLSTHAIGLIVKKHVKRIKLSSEYYSGHSLRAGFATTAAKNHATLDEIMAQTGHKKADTVLQYIRRANVFKNNASTKLGL